MAAPTPPAIPTPPAGPRSPTSRTRAASSNPSTWIPARTASRSWPPSAGNLANQIQQIEVLVDNQQEAWVTPVSTSYTLYETWNFTVAAPSTHTIEFLGVGPAGSDNTALIDAVSLVATDDQLINGSFESPSLPAWAVALQANGGAWQYSGDCRVSTNGSSLTVDNVNAPSGYQVAYIQNTGGMTQTVNLDAGAVQRLVPGRATHRWPDPERADRGAGRWRKSAIGSRPPPPAPRTFLTSR